MKNCRICGSAFEPFLSFGKMPIANGFLAPERFGDEFFFDLAVAFCPKCRMVQLVDQPDPGKMFHEHYAFFSSTSKRMAAHFKKFAEAVRADFLKEADPFVVEAGSNDGILLEHFAGWGIRHLGVEPSADVAKAAEEKGVKTLCKFFDEKTAGEILKTHGPADVFLGANVMCHIPDLHAVFGGVKKMLKPQGVLIFEDPYLGDIVQKTSYDQIYDEHAFYFSLESVGHLLQTHGFEVIDAVSMDVHGGSMRYTAARKGARDPSPRVAQLREREKALGLDKLETFHQLKKNVEASRDELLALLKKLKAQKNRIVGYGATSKSATVTNYCGITPEMIDFISDTTPIKQGKFSPGAHIPIRPYDEFKASYPHFALLFAWNHATEIMAKERDFQKANGRWIVYVPKVAIL